MKVQLLWNTGLHNARGLHNMIIEPKGASDWTVSLSTLKGGDCFLAEGHPLCMVLDWPLNPGHVSTARLRDGYIHNYPANMQVLPKPNAKVVY